MRGINQATIVGTLGGDPEVKYLPDGKCVTSFSMATNEQWKDKQTGEKRESVEWHKIVSFGKVAEILGQHCLKGSKLYIQGKIKTRKWFDEANAIDRYTTEIHVNTFEFLGGENQGGNQVSQPQGRPQQPQNASGQSGSPEVFDDDIPF